MSKFIHSQLGFECLIPEGWAELPVAWARKAKLSGSAASEKLDELLKANSDEPFLSLHLPESDPSASVPMIQCTAKPLDMMQYIGGPDKVIDASIVYMESAFPDFQLMQRQPLYVMAGVSGAYAKLSMSVINEHDVKFPSQSELIVLRAAWYCLIIGLTGPANPEEQLTTDFETFVRSIRLS